MPVQDSILLHTKLHRPRFPHDLVVRQRLTELLDHGADRPLTLVCAPAGFGKTTLIATWIERMVASQVQLESSMPSAWLSLDGNDSDLNQFLRYFIAAVQTIFDDACQETLALLQAREQPPLAVIFTTLSNDIERLPKEFILVLDDYHTIHNIEVHNLLGEFVRFWPSKLHLILISRISPPLPLDKFRAKGLLNEIRTGELRFSQNEIFTYLSQTQFALMGQDALAYLEKHFEGWPAGLHLAAISMRSARSQEAVLKALASENQNITRYMVEEVLNQQVPQVQAFLLRTSILDRFNASLCEAIIGKVEGAWNARACLDWIERSEMFITALDDRREWYRYHHLFQELLQQRLFTDLSSDQVNDLHRLASAWFEEHGYLDEAMQHAIKAGDLELAAHQMSAGLRDVINREDRPTLDRWLHLIPEEMIQQRPELLMLRAWSLQFAWQLSLQMKVLHQVEELLNTQQDGTLSENEVKMLRGQILLPKAQLAYFTNQQTLAIELCRQALALMPPSWTFIRGGAMIYLGLSMQASGQASEAEQMLIDEYERHRDKSDTFALFVLQTLGFIYLNTGQLDKTRQIIEVLIRGATSSRLGLMKLWGEWFLGMVCYQRNELGAAKQYFTHIFENRYIAQVSPFRDAVAGLALIHQIKGENHEALRMVEAISQHDLELSGTEDHRTQSLRAKIMLLQGDINGAINFISAITGPPPDQPLMWLEELQVTRAQILTASASETDLHLAVDLLDNLYEIVVRTCNTRYTIEILALRALSLDALGKTKEADNELIKAVNLAQLGGFIRIFVNLGGPMHKILQRLATQGRSGEYIHSLLEAFQEEGKNLAQSKRQSRMMRRPAAGNSNLVEALTPRELEVLNLLRGPSSIKEIAVQLNISYATAKRHTINIYGKLGVNQRWNAVDKAISLKILSPS